VRLRRRALVVAHRAPERRPHAHAPVGPNSRSTNAAMGCSVRGLVHDVRHAIASMLHAARDACARCHAASVHVACCSATVLGCSAAVCAGAPLLRYGCCRHPTVSSTASRAVKRPDCLPTGACSAGRHGRGSFGRKLSPGMAWHGMAWHGMAYSVGTASLA
jgi:hypothetical protein